MKRKWALQRCNPSEIIGVTKKEGVFTPFFIFVIMKYKILLFLLVLFTQYANGQLRIIRHQDDMTDNVYYYPSEGFIIKSTDGESAFRVSLNVKSKNDVLIEDGLSLKVVNVGSCYENNKVTFLFENGEKFTLTSWNKFNCEGDCYFEMTDSNWDLMKSQKVTKVRFENGRSYESLTGEVETKDYFIKLNALMIENKYEKE
jgi:hypothetical protein